MNALRLLLALVAAFLFSGCLQVDSVVSVKSDGSGTVTQNVTMSKKAIEQIASIAQGFGGKKDGAKQKSFDLLDEAKLKAAAAKMGNGVTFVSVKKISTEESSGYVVVYAFKDINTLKVNQNPSDAIPDFGGAGKKEEKFEFMTFTFTKGSPASLVINTPGGAIKPRKEKDGISDADAEKGIKMAQQMFKDMKLTIAVQVEGTIAETDAEHVAGNRITMAEMDFNKLLADPAKLKELTKAEPGSFEEAKRLMKGVNGIKVETKSAVKVKF